MSAKLLFISAVLSNFIKSEDWFYIKNILNEPDGKAVVVDVDHDVVGCLGAKLIVCPLQWGRLSQHWAWKGKMLYNRANGMVIDIKGDILQHGRHLISFKPNNSSNQMWTISKTEDKDIVYVESLVYTNFVMDIDLHGILPNEMCNAFLRGRRLILYEKHSSDNQKFDFIKAFTCGNG
ncbi:hypothetical protein CHUAL_001141 [Chamberlinius hualienensis]